MPGIMTKEMRVRSSSFELWFGILSGPVAWAINLQLRYALVSWACGRKAGWFFTLIGLPFFLVCCAGAFAAWRGWTRGREEGSFPDRVRFMALSGLALSLIFALTIVASTIPDFFLRPCD